jgi:sugar phosphate isomerase/epimerase
MKNVTTPRTTLSRRTLLQGSVAAIPMMYWPAHAARTLACGLQLYTVREAMAKDLPGTLATVAKMGYTEVEFAGYFGVSPADIRRILGDLDLAAPCSHIDARAAREEPSPLVDAAAEAGHDYMAIAWLPPEDRQTVDQYRSWAGTLNRVGEACKAAGLGFAYHNHDFEFVAIDDVVPYDVLMSETDPELVEFELDFFWVRRAGRTVRSVLRTAPERFTLAHIKDMDESGNMVDVGAGVIDFASILADPAASHMKHLFVEHDDPGDPFGSAKAGQRALAAILRELD